MVVWRAKVENDWLYRAQTITERFVTKPEEYDEPTWWPGCSRWPTPTPRAGSC